MSSPPSSIGVFDSGVGGLTVVAALKRHMPRVPIVYLGDTARLPYGTKSGSTIARYTRRNVDFLLSQGVTAVVVACNTASALAFDSLDPGVPAWGVVGPGASEAARVSKGKVGVLATESTVASGAYTRALLLARPELAIESQACPLFVPLVEEGLEDDPVTEEIARRYLAPLKASAVDTLVLGCTHYPLLAPLLARVAGPDIALVDSAEATAKRVARDLPGSESAPDGGDRFFVTDAAERFSRIARQFLGRDSLDLEVVDV